MGPDEFTGKACHTLKIDFQKFGCLKIKNVFLRSKDAISKSVYD